MTHFRLKEFRMFAAAVLIAAPGARAQTVSDSLIAQKLVVAGLSSPGAFKLLKELTTEAPHRLSGSAGAERAVSLTLEMMKRLGFENARVESCLVPHWVRGPVERAQVADGSRQIPLSICALGGSIATPAAGVTGEVIEVHSFDELRALGDQARGKIIFFNRPMDPSKLSSFEAYGGAVDQRGSGAVEAATHGGIAALVRSMTLALDDKPHTGWMGYQEGVPKVPGAAVSTVGAEALSALLKKSPHAKLTITLSCETLPDVPSANVLGELRGTERPDDIVVVGGHLDCWDKGVGAHDDGSGCVQALEALTLLKKIGVHPKRTIRAVMFMNEENGSRGGKAYAVAPARRREKHVAAIESDAGGFNPVGFGVQADSIVLSKVLAWRPLFVSLEAGMIGEGHGGVDISPIVDQGVPGFGLHPVSHRYFDVHHSDNDTLEAVNPRELEMGAIVEALLCYLIAEKGL